MSKRSIDTFFSPQTAKKPRKSSPEPSSETSSHPIYPFAISHLPPEIESTLSFCPATDPKEINHLPDLDLLYFQPYIPSEISHSLFTFLRQSLPFYRVTYQIKRGAFETTINTPRFTTVFGLDATSSFTPTGSILDSTSQKPAAKDRYKCSPRALPHSLDTLRRLVEAATSETFNFCLVNYYANGSDSISYHSDDERFLGADPTIASLSLGARRDFLMRHKAGPAKDGNGDGGGVAKKGKDGGAGETLKFPLAEGDMIVMRGKTQANWLHSIPKRKGGESEQGRINITFRKALVKGGTDNYYQYNVGTGPVFRWDKKKGEMILWKGEEKVKALHNS